jgi:hypothetical protein
VGNAEGERPLGRTKRRRVGNVKTDLRKIGWDGMDYIDLAENRDQWRALVNTVMNRKMLGSCSVAAQLAASPEGLSCLKCLRSAGK